MRTAGKPFQSLSSNYSEFSKVFQVLFTLSAAQHTQILVRGKKTATKTRQLSFYRAYKAEPQEPQNFVPRIFFAPHWPQNTGFSAVAAISGAAFGTGA